MPTTPSVTGINPAQSGMGLRLTPSNSPYYRASGSRSPSKLSRNWNEPSLLSLKRIIGITTASPNAFDCSESHKTLAYTAGAAAVVVKLDGGPCTSQRFFRARPTVVPSSVPASSTTPSTPNGPFAASRARSLVSTRDGGGSPLAPDSPMGDWGDSPSSRTWTARERIKAASCVSQSPNGKFLAVGETGYNPRVLNFSLADDSPQDKPLSAVAEHTFGICAVAFSPDSRFLASLGTSSDGCLFIWAVNAKTGYLKLHSSSKCTSFVRALVWINSSTLVTAGVRHVKVWRVEETRANSPSKSRFMTEAKGPNTPQASAPKSLLGRNCLLGPMLDTVFTCATAVGNDKAILCSLSGEVCLVDDSDKSQKLLRIGKLHFGISCVSFSAAREELWIGGADGNICVSLLNDILSVKENAELMSACHTVDGPGDKRTDLIALSGAGSLLLSVDILRSIHVFSIDRRNTEIHISPSSMELPAHPDAVMGVKALPQVDASLASFFTWCRGGTVFFWDAEGQKKRALSIELEQFPREDEDPLNELKVVQASPRCTFLVSGDKFGVLRIMDGVTGESHFYTKAHDSEIMDLAILETDSRTLVASCSRDRTIQLFHCINGNWTLAQTMGEHTSCVNRLLFWNDGETLISASADRTILIRKLASREVEGEAIIAFLPSQTLGLRAAPVSMAASPDEPDILVVSTLDRCIHRFQMSSGRNINTFRASDSENGDAVIIDSLMLGSTKATPTLSNLVIGTSTTDKSLRVYDQSGTLLSKEWGHTEGVSNAALVGSTSASSEQPSTTMLVSTGVDGTIMIYDIASKAQHVRRDSDDTEQSQDSPSTKDLTASRTPLRRVLSKSDLAEFQRNTAPTDIPPVPSLGNRSPPRTIRKKASNATLSQSTRLGLPFRGGFSGSENSPTPTSREIAARKARRDRSPSPPSPKAGSQPTGFKRPSLDARFRTKSAGNLTETGQLCQTLRAYRANLNNSPETPRPDNLKELERELKLTTKALAEKLMRPDKSEDVEVTKLLDDYSERLVGMIDEKLALGSRRKASGGFESLGLVTPPNAVGEG